MRSGLALAGRADAAGIEVLANALGSCAMEILRSVEPAARGLYTGTVGWVGFDRSADLNVAIRSGHLRDGRFSFGAGGGIVWDSRPDDEWNELQLKARGMMLALGLEAGETAMAERS